MITTNAMLAIATAIVAISAFGLIGPVTKASAFPGGPKMSATSPTPIPQPSECDVRVGNEISQTTVAISSVDTGFSMTKHAEKEIYKCFISGQPTASFVLDSTLYTNIRATESGKAETLVFGWQNVICAKDARVIGDNQPGYSGLVYSCETLPVRVGSLPTLTNCVQLSLKTPQQMDTVVINGLAKTVESQKELFKCGNTMQEVIIWTFVLDNPTDGSAMFYAVTTCQKPATTNELGPLPLISCSNEGSFPLVS